MDYENLLKTNLGVYITDLQAPKKLSCSIMSISIHQHEVFKKILPRNEIMRESHTHTLIRLNEPSLQTTTLHNLRDGKRISVSVGKL